jgi:hypothetical protein
LKNSFLKQSILIQARGLDLRSSFQAKHEGWYILTPHCQIVGKRCWCKRYPIRMKSFAEPKYFYRLSVRQITIRPPCLNPSRTVTVKCRNIS